MGSCVCLKKLLFVRTANAPLEIAGKNGQSMGMGDGPKPMRLFHGVRILKESSLWGLYYIEERR